MTLTFELDLVKIKLNQRAKYLHQRSIRSKVIVQTRREIHIGPITLPGPLKWSVIRNAAH